MNVQLGVVVVDADGPDGDAVRHAVHFLSERHDWRTPRATFDGLHREFAFTLDVCATAESALLPRFYTEETDALLRPWKNERAFCNPPYGRAIGRWMEKVYTEAGSAELIVALVPSRTDTAWWHDYAMQADEIRFLRGRLDFGGPRRAGHNAPFPSCVLVYRQPHPPRNRGQDLTPEPATPSSGAIGSSGEAQAP